MSNPHGNLVWYELMSPDPAGSKAFYDAVVGWDIDARSAMPGGQDYRMIKRSDGGNAGGVLALTPEMTAHGARPIWLMYVGVDDVDKTVSAFEQRGGKLLMPATDIPNVGRIAMVADPQGAPLYVMKPTPPAGAPDAVSDVFDASAEQRFNWNELSTRDPAAALDFYGQLFGWVSTEAMDMGDFGQYHFLDHHGQRIGAMAGLSPGQVPAWRCYIKVASIDRSVDRVEAGGGTVSRGPHEVPGGMHIVIGTDPQGAEFALVGPR